MPRFRDGLAVCLIGLSVVHVFAEDRKPQDAAKPEPVKFEKTATIDAATKGKTESKEECAKPENGKVAIGSERPDATHKQARVLTPMHDGKKIGLNTYCLTPAGEVLACVGGSSIEYVPKADDPSNPEMKRIDAKSLVQKYSPDGDLLASFPLDFKPTAINMIPGGKQFVVAGEGWLARMSLAGETIKKSRTPNVGDYEKFKSKALEEAKSQRQEFVGQMDEQLKEVEKTLANLEKTPAADRTKTVKAQIEAQTIMAKQLKEQIEQMDQAFGFSDPEAAARDRLTVTGVAVTDKDLFVSVRQMKGHGYEVWRTSHDFTDGEKVVNGLGGCCGQLDIQASSDKLLIAENGKFRVGIYDREGELTKSFGKRDRKASDGFGSCCNPMNVRCCANGEVLTAESSIGDIKRFTADGKFVGYVGRAKIGGGCKHVAIEYDATRDRYYMQHQDKGQICVLVPKSEITGPTEDEVQARTAREGLGSKLVGSWALPGAKKAKKKGVFGLFNALGAGNENPQGPSDQLTFGENGELKVTGGMLAQYSTNSELEWTAIRQDGKHLTVGIVIEGVETFNFKVTFDSDEALKIDLCYDENTMSSGSYQRAASNPAAADKESSPAVPAGTPE